MVCLDGGLCSLSAPSFDFVNAQYSRLGLLIIKSTRLHRQTPMDKWTIIQTAKHKL